MDYIFLKYENSFPGYSGYTWWKEMGFGFLYSIRTTVDKGKNEKYFCINKKESKKFLISISYPQELLLLPQNYLV